MAITLQATPVLYNEFALLAAGEPGKQKIVRGRMEIGAVYATGGIAVTPAELAGTDSQGKARAGAIQSITFTPADDNGGEGLVSAYFDIGTGKILAFVSSTGLQVAAAVDLTAALFVFEAQLKTLA